MEELSNNIRVLFHNINQLQDNTQNTTNDIIILINNFTQLKSDILNSYNNEFESTLYIIRTVDIMDRIVRQLCATKYPFMKVVDYRYKSILHALLAAGELHLIQPPDLEKVTLLVTKTEQYIEAANYSIQVCNQVYIEGNMIYNQMENDFNL
jgi:hypothetical protein